MKFALILGLLLSVSLVEVSSSQSENEFLASMEKLAANKILKTSVNILKLIKLPEDPEKLKKMEEFILKVAGEKVLKYIKEFATYAGPAGEAVSFALAFFAETQDEKFRRIDARFDQVDQKLNEIVNQVNNFCYFLVINDELIELIPLDVLA